MKEHTSVVMWLSAASAIMFVASLLLIPVILVKLPADFFQNGKARSPRSRLWKYIRNIAGCLLILIGIAMLVLPGQGLLTILLGLELTDFPGKHKAERWIVSRKKVLDSANWLRRKFGKEPLQISKQNA